jgi:glutamate--cysteine ligase
MYDQSSLDAAWDIVKDWTAEERQALRDGVAKHGLHTPFRGGTLLDVARRVVALSRAGLDARAQGDGAGATEAIHLRTVEEIVEKGQSPAEELLALYHGRWGGSVEPVFKEFAF